MLSALLSKISDTLVSTAHGIFLTADRSTHLGFYCSPFLVVTLGVVALVGYLVYLLYRPMNRVRDLSEVGFWHLQDDDKRPRSSARELSREVFRRRRVGDLPPVFPNGWFCLAESRDLKPGGVKSVSAIGQNLALFRGDDGKVHILDAYCPHLGANLGVGGRVYGSCVQCPFHGWRFSGEDGTCTAIPYAEKIPEFAKIKWWPSKEVNGSIYVWYHAEGELPYWYPLEIENITKDEWVYRGRSEHYVATHIQDIPENGADISHLAQLHKANILCGSDLRNTQHSLLDFATHVWDASWKAGEQSDVQMSKLTVDHSVRLFGKFTILTMRVNVQQIGPAIVHLNFDTPFGKAVLLHQVTPMEPLLQKVVHNLYCEPRMPHFYSKLILYGEATMVERDIVVWNHKTFAAKPLLVKEDKYIPKFRRWYAQFYSKSSPTLNSLRKDTLEW